MIGYLQGTVLKCTPESVLLDVAGVGYEIHVPLSTYYEIQKAGSGSVALHIYTHLRDDGLSLFGFWTEQEKLLFTKLLGVSGIGPRLARSILSGAAPGELAAALAAGDVVRLSRTPGVGKKTAERMVLELRDKVQELTSAVAPAQAVASAEDRDLVEALIQLGYKRPAAARAVAATREEIPEAPFHELLRQSLRRLSRA